MIQTRFLVNTVLLLSLCASSAVGQEAADFFQQNCASCHTIGGGRLTGPDLKGVTARKDRAWLKRFIQNPQAVLDSGDPYALQLQQEARGMVMPTISGMTPLMVEALIEMIERESRPPQSRFAGTSISDRPFTPADTQTGAALFTGTQKLSGGGPACIFCHTLGTLGGMGGGRLGPDLTLVYERLGGREAVGAWLSAPATATMQAVYRQHPLESEEILPLLAVVADATQNFQPADYGGQFFFFIAGFAGLCVGLALMGWIWRGRVRTVRRSLIRIARGEE